MSIEGGNVPGGNNPDNPGGNPDPNPAPKDESVALATHQKLLGEKKKVSAENAKLAEELEAFRKKEKEAEISRLESEGKYKEALGLKEKELDGEKVRYQKLNKSVLDGQKLSSFLEAVKGDVASKYWGLIDLDSIGLDSDGNVDKDSVNRAAVSFNEQYGNEIITKPGNPNLPNIAPSTGVVGNPITYEVWKKLPSKEMRLRKKDVIT